MLKDVCILVTNHNVSKTYIQNLVANGFIPTRVIYANIGKHTAPKKLGLITSLKKVVKGILSPNDNPSDIFLQRCLPYITKYCQANNLCSIDLRIQTPDLLKKLNLIYDEMKVQSINDTNLANYIESNVTQNYIIFCGGGILKKNMFATGKKFIHVHPGIVPYIKGADCLLWSNLVKNEIGMSAFFMNEGIDTGEIIRTKRYPIPTIFYKSNIQPSNELAQILINYLDPAYRADILLDCFKQDTNPANWATSHQAEEGEYYHFMHPKLAAVASSKYIKK